MTRAWTLMTAMPPTKGHFNLMNFASQLGDQRAKVIVCTQPSEPFASQRYTAVRNAAIRTNGADVIQMYAPLVQDPSTPGFWKMWTKIMRDYGFKDGDIFVSSELYGQTMADCLNGVFMPYDPDRELYYTKATNIREKMIDYFHDIMPEFQHNLRSTVTIFGAESTGKTTLSKELSYMVNGHWLFEWARPYLETVGPEITVASMEAIWHGQKAIQKSAMQMFDKPFVIQDTDLFSTVGYWEQPHWADALGPVPDDLVKDAISNKSDLYLITQSNIPFEEDVIRYGGDHRESPDEYWISIAERYDLNYVVLRESDFYKRNSEAYLLCKTLARTKAESIFYDRKGM